MKKFTSLLLAALMLATMLTVFAAPAFAKEPDNNNQPDSEPTFSASTSADATKDGSVLSDGHLTIIVAVATAAVFGLGGFFIGKAVGKEKKPATAESDN